MARAHFDEGVDVDAAVSMALPLGFGTASRLTRSCFNSCMGKAWQGVPWLNGSMQSVCVLAYLSRCYLHTPAQLPRVSQSPTLMIGTPSGTARSGGYGRR